MDSKTTIRLGIETLLECVEGTGNIEICVMYKDGRIENLDEESLKEIVDTIEKEKEEAAAAKKNKKKE
jgi:20S proteasome alpha/beta subunit